MKKIIIISAAVILLSVLIFALTSCDNESENENELVGGDWHTWRSYTQDYALTDYLSVCFSTFSDKSGYAVYDASNASRIGSILLKDGEYDAESFTYDEFKIEDFDGDGVKDIGIVVSDGAILLYRLDISAEAWSETNTRGLFVYFGTNNPDNPNSNGNADGIDNSKTRIEAMLQEYGGENIAEILGLFYDGSQPVFNETDHKNPEIELINLTIRNELQDMYNEFMNNRGEDWIKIKSYPFTSEEYLQIVTEYNTYPTYGTDGNIKSYNFSRKENRYITLEDALKDSGMTEDGIAENVKQMYVPESPSKSVGSVKTAGFLIRPSAEGNYTLFLLEVTIDNSEAEPWKYFYQYSPQTDELYRLNGESLFSPDELDKMDPPLLYAQAKG